MTRRSTIKATAATATLLGTFWVLAPATAKADHRRDRLVGDIHALEEMAEHFHDLVHHRTGFSHLDDDAHRIESVVRHLHRTFERGATIHHLQVDFGDVRRAVWHMDRELVHAHQLHHDAHVMSDWHRLKLLASKVAYQLGTTLDISPRHGGHHGGHGRYQRRGQYDRGYGYGGSFRIGPFMFRF